MEPTDDGEGKLGFVYIDRERERALPRPPERKALPKPKPTGKEQETGQGCDEAQGSGQEAAIGALIADRAWQRESGAIATTGGA